MHRPVLLNEVIQALNPKPGEFFIDGTLGGGGHALAILEKISPGGKLLVVDWDKSAVEVFKSKVKNSESTIVAVNDNFANLPDILEREKLGRANGLLLDLGMSSDQLESSGRGFSFSRDEPLLMTFDVAAVPAREILKNLTEQELSEIIRKYGEEKYAQAIAGSIKRRQKTGPLETTRSLAEAIETAVPKQYERGRIHPATRTFMALRIYANRELENLELILKSLESVLRPGGKMAIISFHSLEDRLVKNYFRGLSKANKLKILVKKPIVASPEEIKINPRARSAKLRAAQIL